MVNSLECRLCGNKPVKYITECLCKRCYGKQCNPIYYQEHREIILANSAKYRQEHPGYGDASKKKYREAHRIECNTRTIEWGKLHKLNRANNEAKRRIRKKGNGVMDFDIALIVKRDKSICGICHKKVKQGELSIDHIIPISVGGIHKPSNVQVAHRRCNTRRGAGRLPAQIRIPLEAIS